MKKFLLPAFCMLMLLASCSVFTGKRGKTSVTVMEAIQENRIDEAAQYFDLKFDPSVHPDSFKMGIRFFRNNLLSSFGTGLKFTYVKTVDEGTVKKKKSKEYATSYVQFENAKYFGYIRVVFLKKTYKIVHIEIHDTIAPVPDQSRFWHHMAAPLLVVLFNLYVIILLIRSKLKWKWAFVPFVFLFNFPALQISSLGLYQIAFRNEFLMGFGMNMAGYEFSYIAAGVPLGGLIMLAYLSFRKK